MIPAKIFDLQNTIIHPMKNVGYHHQITVCFMPVKAPVLLYCLLNFCEV